MVLKDESHKSNPKPDIYFLLKESYLDVEKLKLLKTRLVNEVKYSERWTLEDLIKIVEDSFDEFDTTSVPFSQVELTY